MISEFHSHAFMLTSFCDFKWKEDENKFEREYKERIIAQLFLGIKKFRKKIKAFKCISNILEQQACLWEKKKVKSNKKQSTVHCIHTWHYLQI